MQAREHKSGSLALRFAVCVIASFAVGLCAFFFIRLAGKSLIDNLYMSDSRRLARQSAYFAQYGEYVSKNNISSSDTDLTKKWCQRKKYVTVSVSKDISPLVGAENQISGHSRLWRIPYSGTVRFADGDYTVYLYDFTEKRLHSRIVAAAAVIGFLAAGTLIMHTFIKMLMRIKRINEEIELINAGELNRNIDEKGNDEISSLAKSAENMRKSIISHYENEQKAYRSNTELVTAISHDIRTPLTSLLLYADALADGKVTDAELIKKYAEICRDKAKQLKSLTDTMFRYFLLFSKTDADFDVDEYNASELIMQLVGEQSFALSELGFKINTVVIQDECVIMTDAAVLKRVFDNIFSNIKKYADISKPVSVSLSLDDKTLRISVINYISKRKDERLSTNIGLKSCERIMSLVGGKFEYWKNNFVFETLITVPRAHR